MSEPCDTHSHPFIHIVDEQTPSGWSMQAELWSLALRPHPYGEISFVKFGTTVRIYRRCAQCERDRLADRGGWYLWWQLSPSNNNLEYEMQPGVEWYTNFVHHQAMERAPNALWFGMLARVLHRLDIDQPLCFPVLARHTLLRRKLGVDVCCQLYDAVLHVDRHGLHSAELGVMTRDGLEYFNFRWAELTRERVLRLLDTIHCTRQCIVSVIVACVLTDKIKCVGVDAKDYVDFERLVYERVVFDKRIVPYWRLRPATAKPFRRVHVIGAHHYHLDIMFSLGTRRQKNVHEQMAYCLPQAAHILRTFASAMQIEARANRPTTLDPDSLGYYRAGWVLFVAPSMFVLHTLVNRLPPWHTVFAPRIFELALIFARYLPPYVLSHCITYLEKMVCAAEPRIERLVVGVYRSVTRMKLK